MTVSIVISTYNGAKFIVEQLDSIRMQSITADEVLIFDDCSQDNTADIIKEYISKHHLQSWNLTENNENKGWKRNFIEGMKSAQGNLIFPCDQDDVWQSDKLEQMSRIVEQNPAINVLASCCRAVYDDGSSKIYPAIFKKDLFRVEFNERFFNVDCPGCTYCVRGSFFRKILPYWKPEYPHDAFIWRMALITDSLYIVSAPFIDWRRHAESAFAISDKTSRRKREKIQWTLYCEDFCDTLSDYCREKSPEYAEQKMDIIAGLKKWASDRRLFFEHHNPVIGIHLLGSLRYYSGVKQYLGDWYLTYFG